MCQLEGTHIGPVSAAEGLDYHRKGGLRDWEETGRDERIPIPAKL